MRKVNDDALARTAAEGVFGDLLEDDAATGRVVGAEDSRRVAKELLSGFEAVEFERTRTKVGGRDITLRRLVLTSSWEVDPNGVAGH